MDRTDQEQNYKEFVGSMLHRVVGKPTVCHKNMHNEGLNRQIFQNIFNVRLTSLLVDFSVSISKGSIIISLKALSRRKGLKDSGSLEARTSLSSSGRLFSRTSKKSDSQLDQFPTCQQNIIKLIKNFPSNAHQGNCVNQETDRKEECLKQKLLKNNIICMLTAFFNCAPAPKLNFPARIGSTLESLMGSDIGSDGISSSDSRRMALNIATSNLITNCSITYRERGKC